MPGTRNEMTCAASPSTHSLRLLLAALIITSGLAASQQPSHRQTAIHKPTASPLAKSAQSKPGAPDAGLVQAIRENNIGLALMDRRDYAGALGHFQTACVMNPASDTGCLNMGIALLNMRQYEEAQRVLVKSVQRDPQSAPAWYNLALLARAIGDPAAARDDFQKVAAVDPEDSGTQYFLGYLASQDQKYDQAVAAFKRAVELDPLNVSAQYGLSQAEQHVGDEATAKADLERFQRISTEKLGTPVRFLYGEQGRYSLAQEMIAPAGPAPPQIPVQFIDVTARSGLPTARIPPASLARPGPHTRPGGDKASLASFLGSGACILDYDGDGRPDIFLVNGDGKGNAALYRNTGKGTFVNVTKAARLDFHGAGMACAVGDYDNDGHPDLAVTSSDGVLLFHNEGDGTFKDVTDAAGLHPPAPNMDQPPSAPTILAMGATFVDYDHDGDLDLYVTRFTDFPIESTSQPFTFAEDAAAPGNTLWRNNGNGTFVDKTKDLALAGSAPSIAAIGSDLANNQAIDLVVTGWQKYPSVFMNTREGPFRETSPWAISMPGPAAGVVAADFDNDGWMDLAFTHWASPAVTIWRNAQHKSFERMPLVEPGWMRAWGIAALDYDNDGWVDLVAVGETFAGEGRIKLWRNEGPAGFRDLTHETGLDKIVLRNPRAVIAFDFDGDGSPDLLVTENNLPPVLLKNVGGNKNSWLKLALTGDPDNRLAIGTRLEILNGAERQAWDVPASSGYLGQGPPEILTGLGRGGGADVVRIHWLTGLLQSELYVTGQTRTSIPEAEPSEQSQQ
jgi:Flp pilus assembly protein TadD